MVPEKIVILCRDAPEGRQDTWISSPEPSSLSDLKLEKWFPLQGERTHSLYFLSFQDQNREVCGQNNNNRPINLLKVITFSTDYKYTT